MLVCMIFMPAISAVSKMNSMVSDLETLFYDGDGVVTNQSIFYDLEDKADIATNLVSLAGYYNLSNDSHVKKITSTCADIKDRNKSVSKLYDLLKVLDENVNWLLAELSNRNLSDTHATQLLKFTSEYSSETKTIDYSAAQYNTEVSKYNDEVNGFPGSIFKLFAKKAQYFK